MGADDQPVVPEITSTVLAAYEGDEDVYTAFAVGSGSRGYSGDIAAQMRAEARHYARFKTHPLKMVRRWARAAEEMALSSAERMQQEQEERGF